MKQDEVWIIDDDRSIRWVLEKAFSKEGIQTQSFEDASRVVKKITEYQPDVILSDIRMPGIDGITLLNQIVKQYPEIPVIIMTAHSDLDSAISAYEGGAFEYLPKPFDIDEAVALVKRALKKKDMGKVADHSEGVGADTEIIGAAPAMQEVFRAIGRLSRSNITVLITGESGTGKELVAHALHRHSPRADKPFSALNMAAIPKELMESELFGHEKGAFTGATNARKGHFELANGGTLFLDEIGDMHADLQSRLLRVLSSGEFFRVGGHQPVKVDVRIIAATHQNLEGRVASGVFREDLFHRLNVIRVHVPALRERQQDIPALVRHFLNQASLELKVESKHPRPEVLEFLQSLPWPGNVRQLENACRWMTVMASGKEIHLDELPPELTDAARPVVNADQDWETSLKTWAELSLAKGDKAILERATPLFERVLIESAMRYTGGRRQDAAKLLGWGRNTLTRKIKELELE